MNNDKIKLDFLAYPVGSHRVECPECHGGQDRERSLSLSVQEREVLYFCFRASCNFRGRYRTKPNIVQVVTNKPKVAKDADLPGYHRYPINDNNNNTQGWEYRAIDRDKTTPKSKLEIGEWVGLHFPRRITENYAMIVEDRKSAEMFSPFYPTIALLGTNFNSQKAEYILSQGIHHLTIALDEDASAKAVKLAKQWHLIDRVLLLDKDIKDQSEAELEQLRSRL